jgi:hypothetical protein
MGRDRRFPTEVVHQIGQRLDWDHLDIPDQGRLGGIACRHERAPQPLCRRGRHHRDDPGDVPHYAVQRQLPGHQRVVELWRKRHLIAGQQNPERDRHIVCWPGFLQIGGSQIDRHPAQWKTAAGVANRGSHPILTLSHRGIRQPHYHHARHALPDVDLDLDQHAVEPDDRARENLCQHGAPGNASSTRPRDIAVGIVAHGSSGTDFATSPHHETQPRSSEGVA